MAESESLVFVGIESPVGLMLHSHFVQDQAEPALSLIVT